MRRLLMACIAMALGACDGRHGDLCDEAVSCSHANDADYAACVDYYDAYQDVADVQDCSEEYDRFFECFLNDNHCVDIPLTNDEVLVWDESCQDEKDDLDRCID